MVARAFMTAEVSPRIPALTPMVLAMLAREAVGTGNAVRRIDIAPRTSVVRLLPVATYEVAGNVDPSSWVYIIEENRPTGDEVRGAVLYDGMVHVRYMPRPGAPWHGVSPLTSAGLTAGQLGKIERSLTWDAGLTTGGIIPMPDGASAGQTTKVSSILRDGKGGLTALETTVGGFGQGKDAAPRSEYDQKRFGPMVPATSIDLRDKTALWVLAAVGIPPSLFTSQGAALRESYRHFHTNTVEPLGNLIAAELSEKLNRPITFYFPEVVKSDIAARSRALASMLQAGVAPDYAARVIGLPLDITVEAVVESPSVPGN